MLILFLFIPFPVKIYGHSLLGDSGGGLMTRDLSERWFLIGIVSTGRYSYPCTLFQFLFLIFNYKQRQMDSGLILIQNQN